MNGRRGDVPIRIGQDTYTLCMDWNAIATLETRFAVNGVPKPIQDIVRTMSMSMVRDVLWAALQHHHAKAFATPEMVGAVLDIGQASEYADALKNALQLALPTGSSDPRRAARPVVPEVVPPPTGTV